METLILVHNYFSIPIKFKMMKKLLLLFIIIIINTSCSLIDSPKDIVKNFIVSLYKLDFEKAQSFVSDETKKDFNEVKSSLQTSNIFKQIMNSNSALTEEDINKRFSFKNMNENNIGNNSIVELRNIQFNLEKNNGKWKIVFTRKIFNIVFFEPYYSGNIIELFKFVQSDYQRRADLIPNLLMTLNVESNFEKSVITDVVNSRTSAAQIKIDPNDLTSGMLLQFKDAQEKLSQSLERLLLVSENYPNLNSNEAFKNLKIQLESSENRVKVSISNYNLAVKDYNMMFDKKYEFLSQNISTKNENVPTIKF